MLTATDRNASEVVQQRERAGRERAGDVGPFARLPSSRWCARSARRTWSGARHPEGTEPSRRPAMVFRPTLPTTSRSALELTTRSSSASTGAPSIERSSTLPAPLR